MTWKNLARVLKYAWMALLCAAALWYLATHWADFAGYAREVGVDAIALSFATLLLGKVLLAQMSREALKPFRLELTFARAFWIYSLSQLGKYLPGSIWHFVGRVVLYRNEGLPAKEGTKLLVLENFWLLGTAAALGVAACADRLVVLAGIALPVGVSWSLSLPVVLGLWLVVFFAGTQQIVRRFGAADVATARAFVLEVATWIVLGLSFWALLPPGARTADTVVLATGAFALGWAGGYLAPFAPAGVGVREAIIVALMADVADVPVAIAVVSFSRLVWTVTELALGALASGLLGKPKAMPEG